MKQTLLGLTLMASLMVAALAPAVAPRTYAAAPAASYSASHAMFLDKTRFLLHVGLAYGAFHHWILLPYQKHAFNKGAKGRVTAIVKAGVAALFTYHELKVAYDIANKSHSGFLHVLVSPINAFMNLASSTGAKLKGGNFNPADIVNLSGAAGVLSSAAGKAGLTIKDISSNL